MFVIKKVKNTVPWIYIISEINGEEFVNYEKELQKINQTEFKIKNVIKRKSGRLHILNGKATIILLAVGLIKR